MLSNTSCIEVWKAWKLYVWKYRKKISLTKCFTKARGINLGRRSDSTALCYLTLFETISFWRMRFQLFAFLSNVKRTLWRSILSFLTHVNFKREFLIYKENQKFRVLEVHLVAGLGISCPLATQIQLFSREDTNRQKTAAPTVSQM